MTLDEAIKTYTDNAEYERTHGNLQGCLEFKQLAEWLKELKQLREQTRWIPISEKLPKEGEEVLVSGYDTYNKKVIIARYQGEQYGFTCGLVSAWMPLPGPYKAESEEV